MRFGFHLALLWASASLAATDSGQSDSALSLSQRGLEALRAREWATAVELLRKAETIPLTDWDLDSRVLHLAALPPDAVEQQRARFSLEVQSGLLEGLCWLGRPDDATRVLESLAALKARSAFLRAGPLPANAHRLGQAEAESGGRAVERWVRDTESHAAQDPLYWVGRAQYYEGRGAVAEAETAWTKGMRFGEAPRPVDAVALRAVAKGYLAFLRDQRRRPEAITIATNAIRTLDPDSPVALEMAAELPGMLASEGVFATDDERLWSWLSRRQAWERPEEKILGALMRASRGAEVREVRSRAEDLARRSVSGRALVMSEVLFSQRYPEHALEFARKAAETATDVHARRKAEALAKQIAKSR